MKDFTKDSNHVASLMGVDVSNESVKFVIKNYDGDDSATFIIERAKFDGISTCSVIESFDHGKTEVGVNANIRLYGEFSQYADMPKLSDRLVGIIKDELHAENDLVLVNPVYVNYDQDGLSVDYISIMYPISTQTIFNPLMKVLERMEYEFLEDHATRSIINSINVVQYLGKDRRSQIYNRNELPIRYNKISDKLGIDKRLNVIDATEDLLLNSLRVHERRYYDTLKVVREVLKSKVQPEDSSVIKESTSNCPSNSEITEVPKSQVVTVDLTDELKLIYRLTIGKCKCKDLLRVKIISNLMYSNYADIEYLNTAVNSMMEFMQNSIDCGTTYDNFNIPMELIHCKVLKDK